MADRQIQLPPGCQGLELAGRTYHGRGPNGGGYISVPEEHADIIGSVDTGGIISGGFRVRVRTKAGRKCPACGSRWYAWTTECRRCKVATEPE